MKNRLLLLIIFAVLALVGSVQAQGNELPLFLWIRGDLYSVDTLDAAPTQLTNDGTISGPVLAPDGKTIAYKAAAKVGLDALSRIQSSGKIADFDLPADIYLFDVSGRSSASVAAQPADASLLVAGKPDKAIIRSTPSWSPDGTHLAWTEYAYPGGKPGIVVYDLASGATKTIAQNIPAPLVQGAAPPIRWGGGGFAINASLDNAGEQDFLLYAEDGTLLSSPRLAAVANDPTLDFVWVDTANGAQLGIVYQSSGWILIDPKTGVAQATTALPHIVTAQPNSRAVSFGVVPDTGFFWEIDGENAAAAGAPGQVTLSPSGREIAFIGYPSSGAVSIWHDGDASTIPNTGSNLNELQVGALLWGYTTWRIG